MPPETAYMSLETLAHLAPEAVLIAAATLIYVAGAFVPARGAWSRLAVAAVVVAGFLWWQGGGPAALAGPLAADGLAYLVRGLVLLLGGLLVLLSARAAADGQSSEYAGSVLLAVAGAMLVATASELVLLFLGLELISIPTYVLLYLGRRDAASQEAAVKYFFLSILSSAVMLYGFSFLYGATGSTRLADVFLTLQPGTPAAEAARPLAGLAVVLMLAGLSFKIAAVPFHFYAPDVYQGTTHGNAALLAVLPKVAGLVALVRLLALAMPASAGVGWRVALILAVMTMTVGNVLALWQQNIRRLLAYSSVAHAGYMLIGLAVGVAANLPGVQVDAAAGLGAAIFYAGVYALATTGAFAALAYLGDREKQIDGVDELAGLGRTHPLVGLALGICLFSLAGVPPLAGFWGKFSLFLGALSVEADEGGVRAWFLALAVIGALNAAIAAAYYLRVLGVMYFRAPRATLRGEGGTGAWTAMVVATALVVAVGLLPTALPRAYRAIESAQSLQRATLEATAQSRPAEPRVGQRPEGPQ